MIVGRLIGTCMPHMPGSQYIDSYPNITDVEQSRVHQTDCSLDGTSLNPNPKQKLTLVVILILTITQTLTMVIK